MNVFCLLDSCTSLVQVEEQHLDYMCLECRAMAFKGISDLKSSWKGEKKKMYVILTASFLDIFVNLFVII